MSSKRAVSQIYRNIGRIEVNQILTLTISIFAVCADFRNFGFTTSKDALNFELEMQKKSALLVALYMAKNKGGGTKSRQTLYEYLKEEGSTDKELVLEFGPMADAKMLLTLKKASNEAFYSFLGSAVLQMLGSWTGRDFIIGDQDK